jgi:exodeoxyribonuclease VII small subunit
MGAKSFEKNYEELMETIKTMERSDIPLKDLLKNFEKASLLYEKCISELEEAKKKITIIKENKNSITESIFEEREE